MPSWRPKAADLWSLSGVARGRRRAQEHTLWRLEAEGCAVRFLDGGPSGSFCLETGQSHGGLGIVHSIIASVPERSSGIVGNCNSPTSSRANLEASVLLAHTPLGAAKLSAMVARRTDKSVELVPRLRAREGSRSMTPRRGWSLRRHAAGAGIAEEDTDKVSHGEGAKLPI